MKKHFGFILFTVLTLALCVPQVFAQASGSVKGICKDPEGKPIAGGVVQFENLDNGQKYALKTNGKGEYFSLGLSAGSVVRQIAPPGRMFLNIVYELLLPMMVLWLCLLRGRERAALVLTYVAEMVAAPMLYMILPACGPVCAFGASWLASPTAPWQAVRLDGMPNAFPSLHVATALVLVLCAKTPLWRAISLVFLAGTGLSTLTTGEHHVIDLVAGLSFGCAAVAAGRRNPAQAMIHLARCSIQAERETFRLI